MKFIAMHGPREEAVEVTRTASGFRVLVGESNYEIDAAALGLSHRSLIYEGNQYEVSVRDVASGKYEVASRRGVSSVAVLDPLAHLAAQTRGQGADTQGSQVTAYMPGRVVTVLVEEGQEVKPGQGLLVLEAMKMENEITSEIEGTVTRLAVAEGEAVEGGDLLVEISAGGAAS